MKQNRWQFQLAMRDDESLSPYAKLVGSMLSFRMKTDGRCDPGIARIAADTGLSENAVRNAIAELEGRDREPRKPRHPRYAHLRTTRGGGLRRGGEGATNLYEATPWNPSPNEPFTKSARGAPEEVLKTGTSLKRKALNQKPREQKERSVQPSRNTPRRTEAEDPPEVAAQYDEFWASTRKPTRGAYWEPGT